MENANNKQDNLQEIISAVCTAIKENGGFTITVTIDIKSKDFIEKQK